MIRALSFKMAYRHVRAGFGRMALSVVAVALGVALVVAFQLMNAAVLQSFLDSVDAMAGRAQLSVSAGEGLTFSEELVRTVAAVPGVKLAVPLVRSVAFPDDGSGEMLTVQGVDLTNEAAVRVYHDADHASEVIDDMVTFLNAPDAIVVGRELAERRGLKKGSKLPLVTPSGVRDFTIQGLLDAQGLARTLRGRLVVMDLYAAERAFTADAQINQIDVVLADGHDVETAKVEIAKLLPPALKVEEPALRRELVGKTVAGFQMLLSAFSLLAILAGVVICYSRLSAVFEARTWEAGLLRAVGMSRARVFFELLKESLLLGAMGTFIGAGVGSLIARYALPLVADATAIALKLPAVSAETTPTRSAIVLGIVVGLLAALGAALAPALRLARSEPVDALSLRGRETLHRASGYAWLLRLAPLPLTAAMIVWQQHWRTPVIGHFTTLLMMVATCTMATPLLRTAARSVTWLVQVIFGAPSATGIRRLAAQPRRAGLSVAALGVGLGTVFLFGLLGWSFERTLAARLTGQLRSDLVITSALNGEGGRAASLDDRLLAELRGLPGVNAVAALQQRLVRSSYGMVTATAYDSRLFRDQRLFQWRLGQESLPDALARVASGDALMVSSSFAYEHGVGPGNTIELTAPNGNLALPVVAIAVDVPINSLVISRERYRALWNDTMVWEIHIAADSQNSVEQVENTISHQLGARLRLRIQSTGDLIDYYASLAHQAFGILYLSEALIFLLVLVAIGDALASSVVEGTRQFGVMRAVGLTRAGLFGIILSEGAVIGLLGLILAAAAGLALGIFWVEIQFPAILGWKLDLHFPTSFALGAAALTLLLCLVGSLLPALRAARLSVPDALRDE
ncbi:MAG: ABC transporter permease [Deltaproteobacteria bacterium]|nr:ABC transporter permease [Deltaproteobacteria bacterium]